MHPRPNTGRYRVLLADDQREVRTSLRRFFEKDGRFEVISEVEDGGEAVAVAARELPDVVVLDLAMPKVNGLEALPRIREAVPLAKIVVLSSMVHFDETAAKAISLGASAAFDKYTPPRKVIEALAKMFKKERRAS
jgi:DNA-binding NarL/FixJ family response regulator